MQKKYRRFFLDVTAKLTRRKNLQSNSDGVQSPALVLNDFGKHKTTFYLNMSNKCYCGSQK